MLESFAVQVVLTVSSAGAGMGIGKQVSKSEKTCLCTYLDLFTPMAVKRCASPVTTDQLEGSTLISMGLQPLANV